jgi:hypothetical protein
MVVGAVVASVGLVDRVRTHEPDLALLCGVVAVTFVTLFVRSAWGQLRAPLRGILARWLLHGAALEGEPVEPLANRSLAAYRSSLESPPTERGPGSTVAGSRR